MPIIRHPNNPDFVAPRSIKTETVGPYMVVEYDDGIITIERESHRGIWEVLTEPSDWDTAVRMASIWNEGIEQEIA